MAWKNVLFFRDTAYRANEDWLHCVHPGLEATGLADQIQCLQIDPAGGADSGHGVDTRPILVAGLLADRRKYISDILGGSILRYPLGDGPVDQMV